ERSMDGAAEPSPRGCDLTSLTAEASLSACVRTPASSLRNAATDFSIPSIRDAAAGSATGAAGLLVFDSRPAMRAVRSAMAAALRRGAGAGACTAGQPSIQPTPITSAAATAPEIGAIAQGDTGLGFGSDGPAASGAGSAAACSASLLSLASAFGASETSV